MRTIKTIKEYIKLTGIQNPNIICCGGSRGGALAKETARYISKYLLCNTITYTYGSPRLGGQDYYNEIQNLCMGVYNFVNAGDPVPSLPPKKAGFVDDFPRIRVDNKSLLNQLKARNCPERQNLYFHKRLLNNELPLSIGGGIGQSRLCMFYLRKAHIGEIQASIWPEEMIKDCYENGIMIL